MNTLAVVTNDIQTMSSVDIAELTGKEHRNVMRDIRKMFGDLGLLRFEQTSFDIQGKERPCFELNKEMTLTLISGYNVKLRHAIVQRWQELEAAQPAIPQTFSEALLLAANQALAIENQSRELEVARPMVEFHNTVVQSEHTYTMTEAGKKIQQRPNKYIQWLRSEGYVSPKGRNIPYQKYIEQGLFVITMVLSNQGRECSQGRVTLKGVSYFERKLRGRQL